MKKYTILLSAICICVLQSVSAQISAGNELTFTAGYGFPTITKTIFSIADGKNVSTSFAGPFYGKLEYKLNETVGFGVDFAYSRGEAAYQTEGEADQNILYNTSFVYTAYSALAAFTFHFGNSATFDPYAHVGMGYRNTNYSFRSDDPDFNQKDLNGFNHFGANLTLGGRLYLTDNIGVYGEVGIAKTPVQVGLSVRF